MRKIPANQLTQEMYGSQVRFAIPVRRRMGPVPHPGHSAGGGEIGMRAAEEWRPIVGYEGRYEVSNLGRVASLPNARRYSRILLSLAVAHKRGGYHFVGLRNGGEEPRKMRKVHQLVCEAFNGPRPEGAQVRHLDGDPTNNRPENLAWGTAAENANDIRVHGTNPQRNQTHCHRGHPLSGENLYVIPSTGGRQCQECQRLTREARKSSRREAAQ